MIHLLIYVVVIILKICICLVLECYKVVGLQIEKEHLRLSR